MADPLWLIDLSILESPDLTLRTWHFCCQGGVVLPPGAAAISRTTWKCQAVVHRLARGRVWCLICDVGICRSWVWSCAKLSTSAMCNPSSEAATAHVTCFSLTGPGGGHTVCPLCGWHLCGLSKSKPLPFWLKRIPGPFCKRSSRKHGDWKDWSSWGDDWHILAWISTKSGYTKPACTDLCTDHGPWLPWFPASHRSGTAPWKPEGAAWHKAWHHMAYHHELPTSCPWVAHLASLRNALEACPTIRHVEIIPGGHILRSSPRHCVTVCHSAQSASAVMVSILIHLILRVIYWCNTPFSRNQLS